MKGLPDGYVNYVGGKVYRGPCLCSVPGRTPGANSDNMCSKMGANYCCTRPKGHTGHHMGCFSGSTCHVGASWPRAGALFPFEEPQP